ncbi:macro domain-containing protein VPA0103 isoform X1 [Manihot esculenta]|uniref:Macro domain-containing protein n=1 Tax=Manihot esculenta TaxID=3983 RepID=A0A2C9V3Z7_MANES|nr:macro domain-containing protein VPA0103 isoform X1 [Manihot esculenta]OAY38256.1 hypothetical protein MANES_10G000700v8 [Manihot esculenta]
MPVDISAGVFRPTFRVPWTSDEHNHVFPLSSSSLLKVIKGDITTWFVDGHSDAIVNPTNELMLPWVASVDLAIHRAAGPQLEFAIADIPEVQSGVRCPTGEAIITPGFKLPASRVIHTVGPIYWYEKNAAAILRYAYRRSLMVAKANKIQYIAFPAISCGNNGYPLKEAATVAISTVKEFADDFKEVHFVLLLDNAYKDWLHVTRELLWN